MQEDTMPNYRKICFWSLVLAVTAIGVTLDVHTRAAAPEFGPVAASVVAAKPTAPDENHLVRFGFLEFESDAAIPGFGPLEKPPAASSAPQVD
jgi:hypothetical protein